MTARWHCLKVPAAELRVEASLFTGQMFGWKRHDGHYVGVLGREVLGLKDCANDTEVCCYTTPAATQPKLKGLVSDMFQLTVPLAPLCDRWGATDPRVKTLRTVLPGLRVVRQDPTECLVSFLCSSNNNIARITLMLDRLRAAYGEKLCTVGTHAMYTFPTMERLAQVEELELREMGFGYRAAFVTRTAR